MRLPELSPTQLEESGRQLVLSFCYFYYFTEQIYLKFHLLTVSLTLTSFRRFQVTCVVL